MRIAYDARPLVEQRTGIGRYLRCFLEALLAYSEVEEILLCSPRKIHAGKALVRDPRVRERRQPGWKGNVWLQLVVPFLLAKSRPDLFHATLFLPPLLARCPSVANLYDLTVYRYPETMEAKNKWPLRLLLPRAVARADKIITLSAFTKKEIDEQWPAASQKTVVVPGAPTLSSDQLSGSPSEENSEQVLAQYGVQKPYILYVGTMDPRKNIVGMLKAFELMHEMGERGLQFILVGHEGWGLQEVRRAREASPVRSAIRYVGYIPDDALAVLYRSAELFLYLSLYEGFGLPPLEAMAAGTCVVASDRGSLPECLGDGAVLVDPFGIEGVAEIAVGLLRDRDLRIEWGRKGRQRAATFSWQRCAEETLSVYKEFS